MSARKITEEFWGRAPQSRYTSERLLYSQAVLNYCYAMYLLMDMGGISSDKKDSLMGRWMTMCLLTGHYQSSTGYRCHERLQRDQGSGDGELSETD